jgi:hypothetical protein
MRPGPNFQSRADKIAGALCRELPRPLTLLRGFFLEEDQTYQILVIQNHEWKMSSFAAKRKARVIKVDDEEEPNDSALSGSDPSFPQNGTFSFAVSARN